MPQNKRDEAIKRHKQKRERLLKQKQQQPRTQPQQQPRTQPHPARAPVQPIVPQYTERANKLGDLIALYLRGDWNYADGLQMARQYAPAGTTEAELRAAVLRAAQAQGKQGNLTIRAIVQPEVVHPQVIVHDLPKQGTLQNVVRGLQAPLRSVAAGATQLAAIRNPRGQYGKETGGKPFPAPQSFAESYASDPTFGSALELAFPNLPMWMRVALGGTADLVLDPVNLLGVGAVKKVVSAPARALGGTQAVQKVAEPVKRVAGAVGTRIMHPTAAKTAGEFAQQLGMSKTQAQALVARAGKLLDENPEFYSIPRTMGDTMQALRNRVERIFNEVRVYDPYMREPTNNLDFLGWWNTVIDFVNAFGGTPLQRTLPASQLDTILRNAEQYLQELKDNIANISNQRVRNRLLTELENLRSDLESIKPVWNRQVRLLQQAIERVSKQEGGTLLLPAFKLAGQSVFNAEVKGSDSVLRKTIDTWKRTKTVYNLGTHTRNFLQNFLFRYLTGDADATDLFRVSGTINDMIRLRNLAERGERVPAELAYQFLTDQPKAGLGVFTARAGNTPSQVFHQLLRSGIQTYDIPIFTIEDALQRFPVSPATQRLGFLQSPETTIKAGTLQSEGGIPIRNLPSSWADVAARVLQINRIKQLVQDLRNPEIRKRGIGRLIARAFIDAYNEGDRTPALIMEAIQRKKKFREHIREQTRGSNEIIRALKSVGKNLTEQKNIKERLYEQSSPYRMDYSAVPELIGTLNIALLPFFNYQYFALRGLREGLRRNPERIYNVIAKPVERATRITQADDEQGVSQSPRFGFADREMIPVSPTRGLPFSTIYPIDPHFAEPLLSPADWLSRSPITAIARPVVLNRDDVLGMAGGLLREFTPPSATHAWYALMGEPQRGLQPALPHTRAERWARAIGYNIQPLDTLRFARQQQRTPQQQQREQLRFDPAQLNDWIRTLLRRLGY